MSSESDSLVDLLAVFDELALEGTAPSAEEFAARYPGQPRLLPRLRSLERLRKDLARLFRPPTAPGAAAAVAGALPAIAGFRLLRKLGEGGMGVVYAAQGEPGGGAPPGCERLCALKVIHPSVPLAVDRMQREASLMARLAHPGIATLYAAAPAHQPPFLVSEFVHGFTLKGLLTVADALGAFDPQAWLKDALKRLSEDAPALAGATPVDLAVRLALEVATALAHVHEQGIVHRDVKPSNIMLTYDGSAKLIDFGLALSLDDFDDPLTCTGAFVGSYPYAAPEQLRGDAAAVMAWSDTYALGATLYELLTQRSPFAGLSFAERIEQAHEPPPFAPRTFNPAVPPALEAVVMRALSPEPGKRFADGAAMASALEAARAPVAGWRALPRLRRWPRRPGAGRGLAPALLTLLLFGACGLWAREVWVRHAETAALAAQLAASGQQVLDFLLAGEQPALEACLDYRLVPPRPSRFVAEVVVDQGAVRLVRELGDSGVVTTVARQCLRAAIERLRVPGVGLAEPIALRVDVRLQTPAP